LSDEKTTELLGPLYSLMNSPKMISSFSSNIAIFRTSQFLRLIGLPVDVEFGAHVADSFHVKPLMTYLNQDFQYLFFGSDGKKGFLYRGTKKSYQLVDEFHFRDEKVFETSTIYRNLRSATQKRKYALEANMSWVVDAISTLDKDRSHSIFLSTNVSETNELRKALKNRNVYWRNVAKRFHPDNEKSTMQTIQKTLEIEKTISLNISLSEFENPAVQRLANTYVSYDLREISKAARLGQVRKLLIASDACIFGTMDQTSGEITLREADIDHTDDDLLDDIAQNVFISGGEVLLLPRQQMPSRELIVGALKNTKPSPSALWINEHLTA
jgi:hypothetical protein